MMIRGAVLVALFAVLTPLGCIASDRGPATIEADTRDENALLEAVQPEMLVGSWYSFKEGLAPTIITQTHVSDIGCKAPYKVVERSVGRSYPDTAPFNTGRTNIEVGRVVTIKIKIQHRDCKNATQGGFLQFSFVTTDTSYSFASVITYDEENRFIGQSHSRKR